MAPFASTHVVFTWTVLALGVAPQSGSASANVRDTYDQLHRRFAAQVEQLAARAESKGNDAEAAEFRKIVTVPASSPEVLSISILPASGSAAGSATANSGGRSDEQAALAKLRKQHGKELFDLASIAFRAGEISVCYDLVREVVDHDPDNGTAESLLGRTKFRDQWVSTYAAGKLRAGQTWDARFGWVSKTQLPRLENGERLWRNQWLPAEEVAKHRRDFQNAWEIETEHYTIRTNTTLERGVAFGDKLEKLYAIFFRLYAGFFSERDQMAVLFDPSKGRSAATKDAARKPRRFRVHFYRMRDEYVAALRPYVKSGLDGTTGMYLTDTRIAYFFVDDKMDEATVVHEATHQLFSETRDHRQTIGSRGNNWAVEGVACYMESFEDRGEHVELGAWTAPRLKLGRDHIVKENKYLPLEKLVQLGMNDFEGPAVYTLYSQSACLARFFMQYDNGRYREAFLKYLEEVYMGRADFQTLASIIGVDHAKLDRQFLDSLQSSSP